MITLSKRPVVATTRIEDVCEAMTQGREISLRSRSGGREEVTGLVYGVSLESGIRVGGGRPSGYNVTLSTAEGIVTVYLPTLPSRFMLRKTHEQD